MSGFHQQKECKRKYSKIINLILILRKLFFKESEHSQTWISEVQGTCTFQTGAGEVFPIYRSLKNTVLDVKTHFLFEFGTENKCIVTSVLKEICLFSLVFIICTHFSSSYILS